MIVSRIQLPAPSEQFEISRSPVDNQCRVWKLDWPSRYKLFEEDEEGFELPKWIQIAVFENKRQAKVFVSKQIMKMTKK